MHTMVDMGFWKEMQMLKHDSDSFFDYWIEILADTTTGKKWHKLKKSRSEVGLHAVLFQGKET